MGLLDADADGLRTLAAQCRCLGAELGGGTAPAVVGLACQATAAAVSTAHSSVALVARALTARLEDTADTLENAGNGFLLEDRQSALGLRGLVTEA